MEGMQEKLRRMKKENPDILEELNNLSKNIDPPFIKEKGAMDLKKKLLDDQLKIAFRNHTDCYTTAKIHDTEITDIPAMSEEMFIMVVSRLLENQ